MHRHHFKQDFLKWMWFYEFKDGKGLITSVLMYFTVLLHYILQYIFLHYINLQWLAMLAAQL